MTSKLAERFLSKTKRHGDCLLWTGALFENGYGAFQVNGKAVRAHRHSFEATAGPIPDGMFVCHKCDVPRCVNPSHLFLGTPKDNAQDRQAKGRGNSPKGERHGMAKLTVRQVKQIRKSKGSNVAVGARFGIGHATVSRIRNRVLWAEVP